MKVRGLLRRHADFRRLWAADAASQIGTQVSALALPLAAVQVTHASTLEVAILPALQTVAFLVLGLPAGVWSDRMRRRPHIVIADLGRLVVLGSIPVAALFGVLTVAQMYVVALIAGVFTVFFEVAFQSFVPVVVDRPSLVEANSRLEINRTVAAAAGPVLAGYLVHWLTAPLAIAVDAASFAWSAAWVTRMTTKEPEPVPTAHERLRRQMADGLRFVVAHPVLRSMISYNGTAMMFFAAQAALEVVFLLREVHAAAETIGLLFAAASCGNLLGALLAGRMTRAVGRRRALLLYTTMAGLSGLLIPMTFRGWGIVLFSLGTGISGFFLAAYNVAQTSFRQTVCPDRLLGRMNATMRTVSLGVMALGSVLGGLLGTWFGVRPTMWVAAVGALLASLWWVRMAVGGRADTPADEPHVAGALPDEPVRK